MSYKPVIKPQIFRREISRDINYFALKQKLKGFGFDFFNYVTFKSDVQKETDIRENYLIHNFSFKNLENFLYYLFIERYGFAEYYQEMNLVILSWYFRLKWKFNKYFGGKV